MRRPLLSLTALTLFILGCSFVPRLTLPTNPAPAGTATSLVVPTQPTQTPVVKIVNDLEDLFVNLYERLSPSVVHITTKTQVFSYFRGTVPQEGTGSGFFYDDQGHIVTNEHVISGADEVEVVLADGTSLKAKVIGSDAYNDLAVLKVDGLPQSQIKPLSLGESHNLKVGMRVLAIGNPFGLDRTLTTGVISALGRTIQRENQDALGEMIQTDAAINPGNSGGPLLNLNGELIGVNSSIQSTSGGSVGIGFAVPVDTLRRVLPDLITSGHYQHPSLGFNAYEINSDMAAALKLPVEKGLLIAQLQSGGAAEKAGVKGATQRVSVYGSTLLTGGDILTAIDDKPMGTTDDMTIYMENNKRPGDTVKLTLLRDGKQLDLNATLDAG
jgi:S1-C subfamily serine protease